MLHSFGHNTLKKHIDLFEMVQHMATEIIQGVLSIHYGGVDSVN